MESYLERISVWYKYFNDSYQHKNAWKHNQSWSWGSGFVLVFPCINLLYTAEKYFSNAFLAFTPTAERWLEPKKPGFSTWVWHKGTGSSGGGGPDVKAEPAGLVLVVGVRSLMWELFPSPGEGTETAEQDNLLGGAAGNISGAEGLPTKHLSLEDFV